MLETLRPKPADSLYQTYRLLKMMPFRLASRVQPNSNLAIAPKRCYAKAINAHAAQKLKINADRLSYGLVPSLTLCERPD